MDYTVLTRSSLFSSSPRDRQEPPHWSSNQNGVCLLVAARGAWGRKKKWLSRVLSPFLETQPISGLLFPWAQNRTGWHKHIKLGNPDSFLPAWGHNSWDIYLSQWRWKPGSFRGKTTYTQSQDRIQWSSVHRSGRLWPRTPQRISPDESFLGWELFLQNGNILIIFFWWYLIMVKHS